jgi:amino acid transporter
MTSQQPRGPWTRKPISVVLQEQEDENLTAHRHLSLFDLVSVGVGGTVGSGIFVLAGLIAHHYAGPATFVSFLLSGLAAACSGLCYAEWAGRLPAAGSTYVYAFVSLGEWAAVIAGACLTLEYGVSGAAVARSWGDKVIEWLVNEWQWDATFLAGEFFNPLAGFISALSVVCLAYGVKESKAVTNTFTVLKVMLVMFMIVGGFWYFRVENLTPLAPFGVTGVLRGATSSFFGYLGYDEVCCLASEAKNPKDMPRAVLWTLAIVTVLYILASIALVGMVPYDEISDTSGFPAAFSSLGVTWAAQVTAAGEVITLPVVVLISLLAQPRLCAAMANDGLLPDILARVDRNGNLFWSIILSGVPMTILATIVPFSYLDDCISVGILIAFNMTDSSLILMKCESSSPSSTPLSRQLIFYHVLSFATGLASSAENRWISIGFVAITCYAAISIRRNCPRTGGFGLSLRRHNSTSNAEEPTVPDNVFEAPFMPILPLFGISMNWYLIAQLEFTGMLLLMLYLGIISLLYMFCRSSRPSWGASYDRILDANAPVLLREMSLPKRYSDNVDASTAP